MLKRSIIIVLATVSTACTQLPRPELRAYSEAFTAAQTAATPLIENYAADERALLVRRMESDAQRTYARFGYFSDLQLSDATAVSNLSLPPGADALTRVFRGISVYNDTLVALAENRNVDEARAQLEQISSDLTATIPGLQTSAPVIGAAVQALTTFLEPLVRMDNEREFRRLVIEGTPQVQTLIDTLREHAPAQYATRVGGLLRQLDLEEDADDRTRLITEINGWHTAFANYVALLDAMKARLGDLSAAVNNPRSAPLLARASVGAGEVRAYADALRRSIGQIGITH